MSEPTRQDQIDSMRRVCDFFEKHPDFKLSYSFSSDPLYVFVDGKDELAAHVRMLGSGEKSGDDTFFRFTRDFGGVRVQVLDYRSTVCERIVVGTKEIETEEVDPVALAALPKVKVTKIVEAVEWRCPEAILAVEVTG